MTDLLGTGHQGDMNVSARPLFLSVVFSFLSSSAALTGCSVGGDGDSSTAASNAAATGPAVCAEGDIHPRVCAAPADAEGNVVLDVNNDVTAACPDGDTLSSGGGDGICCVPPSATTITECSQAPVATVGDASYSYESWAFEATGCSDASWAAAHASVCGDDAVLAATKCQDPATRSLYPTICPTAATPLQVQWPAGTGSSGS